MSLPTPTGDVWTDHGELLAALKSARRSPERYTADALRLLDFAAHVAAMEARAARGGHAGDAALAAFIAEQQAGGADALAVFVAVQQRAGVPEDEPLRRLFLAARERCERVRDAAPSCGPIPPEPSASGSIVAAINALRRWAQVAAGTLDRLRAAGPTRPPDVIPLARVLAEFDVDERTVRRWVKDHKLTDHRPPGHAENAALLIDRNEIVQKTGWPARQNQRSAR